MSAAIALILFPQDSPVHRSTTPKFVTPTAISCIDNSWRSTTLSPPKKLTPSTANLEWCHVDFIRDSYSTFIRQVIGPSKNSMELFFNAKFDFKSTWNQDSTTSHHKHPVCQSPAGEAEKLTNVWSGCFGTNRIIDNWHRCRGVMWRKRKNYFENLFLKKSTDCQFSFHWQQNYLHVMGTLLNHIKKETLVEIKTSLENLWQRMIQLSEFFQDSFVLILKRKCLVGASRVRCGESGTPSTIIYTWWSSRRYELGCDAPVVRFQQQRCQYTEVSTVAANTADFQWYPANIIDFNSLFTVQYRINLCFWNVQIHVALKGQYIYYHIYAFYGVANPQ